MSDVHDFNPDVYWKVNNKKYYRKTNALLAAQKGNYDVEFNYYNGQFNQYNWLIEPSETFEELCNLRAHQLRDTNKYLRLWYSGGADSHTMLMSFINNNIYIDEIVCVRTSPVDDFDAKPNQETNMRSIPFLRSIANTIPKTKISIINVTADQYLTYYKQDDWYVQTTSFDFSDDPGLFLGGQESIERYTSLLINSGTVEVTGGDKPKIIRKDGIYYAPITDSAFQYLYWSNVREFYTTAEFPMLHSKQCHELKHLFERRFPGDDDITHHIYNPKTIDPDFKKEWYHCCRQIINYEVDLGKGWELISPKSKLRLTVAIKHNPELVKYYMGTLKELHPKISRFWTDFDGLVGGIIGGIYCLGP